MLGCQLVFVLFRVRPSASGSEVCSRWCRAPRVTSLLSSRYATVYTMFPVFSLVLDQDVKPEMAMLYPELYKDLTKVRPRLGIRGGKGVRANVCSAALMSRVEL